MTLESWERFRAARLWRVLICAEGAQHTATLTAEGCQAIAAKLPGVPVAIVLLLEHIPFEVYEARGGALPENVIGTILDAHYAPGVGVVATLRLAEAKRDLHHVLVILHAAGVLRAGPSLVCHRSGANGDPITDVETIYGVDIVWIPGHGGRFLAPLASER